MSWIAYRITPSYDRDGVIAALFELGSQGVHEDGDAVVTHFPGDVDTDAVRAAVLRVDSGADIVVRDAPIVPWEEWRATVSAHQLGGLVIAPPWLADDYDPAHAIIIDPAMAFGTGEHATTRLMVRLMQSVIRSGDIVADLGAGSAVLSIAAVKLGAERVVAIELDSNAVGNANENMERNGVADSIRYIEGDASVLLPLVAPVRVIVANIVSSVLLALLPDMAKALTNDGQVIMSGLLEEEREVIVDQLHKGGWTIDAELGESGWWSVAARRSVK